MHFRLTPILALFIGFSSAFADDDFDLPDDVQSTEVVRFVPIEATSTSEPAAQVEKEIPKHVRDEKSEKAREDSLDGSRRHGSGSRMTEETNQDKPAAFKEHRIPEELNRPLRVGIFTGVKELYFKYQGETVHVTATKNKVKSEGGGPNPSPGDDMLFDERPRRFGEGETEDGAS
jgi:stage II sporulation protein D